MEVVMSDNYEEYVEPKHDYTGKVEEDGYIIMPDGHRGISTMTRVIVQHPDLFEDRDFYSFVIFTAQSKPTIPIQNAWRFWGEYVRDMKNK
jgi:hypothetical protein